MAPMPRLAPFIMISWPSGESANQHKADSKFILSTPKRKETFSLTYIRYWKVAMAYPVPMLAVLLLST